MVIIWLKEYRNKTITRIFGGNAYYGCYFLALSIFSFGILRDTIYHKALLEQPKMALLPEPYATVVPAALIGVGQLFVLSSTWALGITGTFLGDYFGILMNHRVEGFPFNTLRDPMYVGSTMCFAGGALCILDCAALRREMTWFAGMEQYLIAFTTNSRRLTFVSRRYMSYNKWNSSESLEMTIYNGFHQWFRLLVPEPKDRIPITPIFLLYWSAYHVPFFFLAYLARRPDTYLMRLLLLPTALICSIVVAYRYTWTISSLNVYNWGQSLAAAVQIAKALEYALTPEGMLKYGEVAPGQLAKASNGSPNGARNGYANGHAYTNGHGHPLPRSKLRSRWPAWLTDTIALTHSLRGLSFTYSKGIHIPAHTRPISSRSAFAKSTFISFVKNFLLLDFLESVIKLFPGVGDPSGGSMFYPSLPLVQRYAVSTFVHILTGSSLLAGFGMVYDLCTFIAVALCDDDPANWPPVLDNPWKSNSMHELWSKRWHQLLRRTFIVFGGLPSYHLVRFLIPPMFPGARKQLSEIVSVVGTFLASGLFHEVAIYTMFSPTNHATFSSAPIIFFGIQAPVLIFERLFSSLSKVLFGRKMRVGGWPGRLWVWFWMFGPVSQNMVDSWHRRGLGSGMVIPPFISPARFLLPFIVPWLAKVAGSLYGGIGITGLVGREVPRADL
ncbi:hypothetical protein D9758_002797 [Tetrapyrgos nigripes]|uniref:Phosphatidyl-N-methylethanolamine N-methyltransferase n=1 Tax=Tetrapyrgos nigripes TaxID=182062 RepID=A0A8H5GR88_9AGAR|nr:hypothetical protein D9758_002797 [Tetrapyrgos nigripes]